MQMTIKVMIAYTADIATELRSERMTAENIQGMLGHRAYSGITDVYAKHPPNI
ncbi:integrase [Xylella fastidiosa]|uniref:Integrase n=2 Tax=Xylella fastidiosa TaxID=2371 RepID=A0ABD7BYH8_XYLFS|nr:integrase [Xylella fastidiosa]